MGFLNWMDAGIVLIVLLAGWRGTGAGLFQCLVQIAGLLAGLIAASRFYPSGGKLLAEYGPLAQNAADLASFVFLFVCTAAAVMILGGMIALPARFRPFKAVNRIGGGIAGLATGALFLSMILVLCTSFPLFFSWREHLAQSRLAPAMIRSLHNLHENVETTFHLKIPRLAFYPEQPAGFSGPGLPRTEFKFIDFSRLDGAICIACGGKVEFLGYLANGYGSLSPKFSCGSCGRTSDGCQTYEGYHLMYDQCLAALGRLGYRFDCGVWPNGSYFRPAGPCPVCGAD
jgi:uncharacterized membrane protein required for colicin V production